MEGCTFEDREAVGGAGCGKFGLGIDKSEGDGDELEVEALLVVIDSVADNPIEHKQ
jgi:hypothetical protein